MSIKRPITKSFRTFFYKNILIQYEKSLDILILEIISLYLKSKKEWILLFLRIPIFIKYGRYKLKYS